MATFVHTSKDDMPSRAVQLAVGKGEWTEGGMAEAGWFLVGEMLNGGPIFSRTNNKVSVSRWELM